MVATVNLSRLFGVLEIVLNTTFRITLNEAIESNTERIKIKKLNMEKPHHICGRHIRLQFFFVINFYLSHTQVYCVDEIWMKGLCIYCCVHIAFAFIYGTSFWLIFFSFLWIQGNRNIFNYTISVKILYSQYRSYDCINIVL